MGQVGGGAYYARCQCPRAEPDERDESSRARSCRWKPRALWRPEPDFARVIGSRPGRIVSPDSEAGVLVWLTGGTAK